jgi:hypothetical protein
MVIIEWNAFETLMGVATGDTQFDGENVDSELLQKLAEKRSQLEKQREIFHQASEDNITEEYKRLRKFHREFLACFNKAKELYTNAIHN